MSQLQLLAWEKLEDPCPASATYSIRSPTHLPNRFIAYKLAIRSLLGVLIRQNQMAIPIEKKTRKQKNNPKLLSHSSRLNYSIVILGGFHSSCPNVKCRRHSLVDADDVVDRSPNLDKSSHPLQWSHQPAATKQNPKGREKNKLTQNDSMLKWPTLKRQKGSPLKRRGFGVESLETPDLPAGRNGNSSNGLGWAPIWMASQEASDHKGSYLTSTDIGPARVHGEKIQGQGY